MPGVCLNIYHIIVCLLEKKRIIKKIILFKLAIVFLCGLCHCISGVCLDT